MFEDLKNKVKESKENEKSDDNQAQLQKSKNFMDSVSSMLDRSQMTDIETDNEFPNQNRIAFHKSIYIIVSYKCMEVFFCEQCEVLPTRK